MLALQNAKSLHSQHPGPSMSLRCPNPVQENIQALSWQSRSFTAGSYLFLQSHGPQAFDSSLLARAKDTFITPAHFCPGCSHLDHLLHMCPIVLKCHWLSLSPLHSSLSPLYSSLMSLLWHLNTLLRPSLPFNYEPLEGRNHSEFFSGSPVPSTGPGTQQVLNECRIHKQMTE